MTPTKQFAVIPFLIANEKSASQTMQAIETITRSCDRAIAQAAPAKQGAELRKAILEEFKAANRIESVTWNDFTVIFVPDRDEYGQYCSEILALETNDGVQHFAPYDDLKADFILPTAEDVTEELRAS